MRAHDLAAAIAERGAGKAVSVRDELLAAIVDAEPMTVEGPQGERGPQGDTGVQGPVGPMGPVGPEGPQGPQGAPGLDGTNGQDGTNGTDGQTGRRGPQGARGEQGERGEKGDQGEPGRDGRNAYGWPRLGGGSSGGASLTVRDEGVSQGAITSLDFAGAGVTVATVAGVATVTIPGGITAPTFLSIAKWA